MDPQRPYQKLVIDRVPIIPALGAVDRKTPKTYRAAGLVNYQAPSSIRYLTQKSGQDMNVEDTNIDL